MSQAKSGDKVKVHYTGTLDGGEIFDSSTGREPLDFTIDDGSMIAGFNEGVKGLAVGEKKKIRIEADDAYGPVREDLVLQVERDRIPAEIELEIGLQLQMPQPGGQPVIVTVTAITEEEVTLDANHKLAGQALNFDVELVEIA